MTSRFTIVMEYENAGTHERAGAASVFVALLRQFSGHPARSEGDRDELILAFDPIDENEDDISQIVGESAPGLYDHVDIRMLPCPGMRYYEFKNAGAKIARGDILVFLDSDLEPEGDWLRTLLAPFDDPAVTAVNGYTYLGHHDFLSRTLALTWTFPLRNDSAREVRRRPLHANNWAVRRSWFARNAFPNHPGFKVSCSLLTAEMQSQGIDLVKVMAFGRHKPLEGLRFTLWRAAVAGRDDDARFATMRSINRSRRVGRAFSRWLKQTLRSARRVLTRRTAVGMPVYEVPAAIAVAWTYYSVFFFAQLASALFGPRSEPERIPHFVVRH